MNHPELVKIESDQVTAERVRQVCYMTANDEKIPLLIGLVRGWDDPRVMVFVNTKREADRVWGYLQGNGINTAVLSGDVPQKKRLSLLKQFQHGELPILVATDVAARGLHIPGVTHVINYDLPDDAEDYVHRIGRTARAGEAGEAISFICETHAFCLPDIEAFIGAKIPSESPDPALLATVDPYSRVRMAPHHPREGFGGRRGAGGHGGGRRDDGGQHGRGARHHGAAPAAQPEQPKEEAKPVEGAPAKKRRRRRSRKPAGGGDTVATPQS
jgi:ATP-dependent RNA helicase RhlB